jgi:tRNA A37 threonylcarbamoyladenosine dehydratase
LERLAKARVAVFGVGGVGSYVVEGLARAGVGHFVLVDNDVVSLTNINRQLHSLTSTIGQQKTELMKARILDINPEAEVQVINAFYLPDNADHFFVDKYDYVVDAIDTVTGKIELIMRAHRAQVPIISSMGAGNKMDASRLEVADISETSVCPLARVMRSECRKRGIRHLKVVYSTEEPRRPLEDPTISCRAHCICPPDTRKCTVRRDIPGSTALVPSVAGLIIAGEVVKDLCGSEKN